jgi:hypothetical protein
MNENEPSSDPVDETGEASAGEAQQGAAAAEEEEQRPDLDERQEKIGATRRRGGPDLHAETDERAEEEQQVPDVEETETEEEEGE